MKKTASWRFWAAAGAGAGVLALFHLVFVSPVSEETARKRTELRAIERRIADLTDPTGTPIEEAETALTGEREALYALQLSSARIALNLPEELRGADGRNTPLYFQQRLADLSNLAVASGMDIPKKLANFGFPPEIPDGEIADNLARLAVVSIFLEGARAAGAQFVSASTPKLRVTPSPLKTSELVELPYKATVQTTEEGLFRLLHHISRPGSFLALTALEIDVEDGASGFLKASLVVAGLVTRDKAPETQDAADEGDTSDPGADVRAPERRRRF